MQWLLVVMLLALPALQALQLTSQQNNPVIINGGNDQVQHIASFLGTRADESSTPGVGTTYDVYDLVDPTKLNWRTVIRVAGATYNYAVTPQEYIPVAAINIPSSSCLLPSANSNISALQATLAHSLSPSLRRAVIRLKVDGFLERLQGARRKLLQLPFVGGLIIGGIAGVLLDRLFGGGNDYSSKFDAIDASISGINNQLHSIENWMSQQEVQKLITNQFLTNIDKQMGLAESQIITLNYDLGLAFNHINTLSNITSMLNERENRDFLAIEGQLATSSYNEQLLFNLTTKLRNVTQTQMQSLGEITNNLDAQVQRLNIILYNFMQDLYMRRNIIDNFWSNVNQDIGLPSIPFMEYSGVAPKSDAQRLAMRNLDGAKTMARVRMTYTEQVGGTRIATELILSYKCDPVAITTNTIPYATFKSLFQQLGPDNALTGRSCYDPAGLATTAWNCTCVITVEKYSCSLTGGSPLFPFAWPDSFSLNLDTRSSGYCDGGNLTPVLPSPGANLNSQVNIFSNMASWTDWFKRFCGNTAFIPYTNGAKVRLFSDLHGHSDDFSLFSNVTDVCTPDIKVFLGYTDNSNRLAYGVYAYWKLAYDENQFSLIDIEKDIYGQIGSNIEYKRKPFVTFPNVADTLRCEDFYYTKISPQKTTVYDVDLVSVQHAVYVTINDGTEVPVTVSSNTTVQTKIPVAGGGEALATSDVILSDDFRNILPANFKMIGPFVDETFSPPRLFDPPTEEVVVGTAISRKDKITWIHQSLDYGPDEPITALTYKNDTHGHYSPEFLGNSAHDFARTVVLAGDKWLCDDAYDMLDEIVPNTGGNGPLCKIMQFYRVTLDKSDPKRWLLRFKPDVYTVSFSLTLPQGVYKQRLVSNCPSNYSSVQATNERVLSFYTTNTQDTQIIVKVTTYNVIGGGCAPQGPYTLIYKAGSPASFTLNACSGQIYVNVYTLTSDLPCYAEPGISGSVDHQASDGPSVPSYVAQSITSAIDESRQQAIALDGDLADLRYRLQQLPRQDWDSLDALEQAIRDNLQQQQDLYDAAKRNASDPVQKAIDDEITRLQNDTQRVIDDQKDIYDKGKRFDELEVKQTQLLLDLAAAQNLSQFLLNKTLAQQEKLDALVDAQLAISNKVDCDSQSGFLGPVTCAFKSFFSNFGSNFFGIIFKFIIIVGFIALIACCAGPCISVCAPIFKGAASSIGTAAKELTKKNKQTPGSSEETTPMAPRSSSSREEFRRVPEVEI